MNLNCYKYEHVELISKIFLPLGPYGRRGIVVGCVRPSVRPSVCPSVRRDLFVRMITPEGFDLDSPNFNQICILARPRLGLLMVDLDLHLQGHSVHFAHI